ncbi:MAG: hypothetical protein HYS05_12870 [Acidobacteria bacterium]|nr:hypothetical protein [Acidobacteriota bacterium]
MKGRHARRTGERGQTFTEYMMILGLLSAIIIALTGIILPGITYVVVRIVKHIALYVSSV